MCDIVKYLQDLVNEIIQFKGLSCSQAETMLTGLGGKLRRQVESECVGQRAEKRPDNRPGAGGLPGAARRRVWSNTPLRGTRTATARAD